jgi:hypothetical protein
MSEGNNENISSNKYYDDLEDSPNVAKGNRMIIDVMQKYFHGYFCILRLGRNSGTDIIVVTKQDGKIYAVVECKNIASKNYICSRDFMRDFENLNLYDQLPEVKKYYFVSYESILSPEQKELLKANHIELKALGYEP